MDYNQAIEVIEKSTGTIQASRQEHILILQAIEKLKELIKPISEAKKEEKA